MKKAILLFICIVFLGCGNRGQLSSEGYKISSVSDTSKCQFIKNMYCEAQAHNMIYYVQLNTEQNGGDSYKIINVSQDRAMGVNIQMINFEIYKCK